MESGNKKGGLMTYILLGAAYVGFVVGASFSTGNELMQYFASYGASGILGSVVAVALIVVLVVTCLLDAQKYHLYTMRDVFVHYGGKYLGLLLYIYAVFFLFVLVVMLVAGAGATFEEYFGINNMLGRAIMAIALFITVILGLNKLIDISGKLSTIIILLMIIVAIIGIVNPVDGFSKGSEMALARDDLARQGSNWFVSGVLYFAWAILCQTAYVASLGKETIHTKSQHIKGLITGGIFVVLLTILPTWAIVSNMSICAGASIPNLMIARNASPVLGTIFSVMVIIAIYTTCSPILWSVADAFMDEKNKYSKFVVAALVVFAFFGSNLGSFTEILYVGTGWSARVGVVFIITILVTKIFRKIPAPDDTAEVAVSEAVAEEVPTSSED